MIDQQYMMLNQHHVCWSVSVGMPSVYLIQYVFAVFVKSHCLSIKMLVSQLLVLSTKSLLWFWSLMLLGISLVICLLSGTIILHYSITFSSILFCSLLVMQHGGNLTIPADRLLHEIAFKLWKAPKYGAWLLLLFNFLSASCHNSRAQCRLPVWTSLASIAGRVMLINMFISDSKLCSII